MNNDEVSLKVGDKVKLDKVGYGVGFKDFEEYKDQTFTVTEVGTYVIWQGIKVDPPIGNMVNGFYNGYIGNPSFTLVEEHPPSVKEVKDAVKVLLKWNETNPNNKVGVNRSSNLCIWDSESMCNKDFSNLHFFLENFGEDHEEISKKELHNL